MYILKNAFRFTKGTYGEIRAWQEGNQKILTPNEFNTLYMCINRYLNKLNEYARNNTAESPYSSYMSKENSGVIAQEKANAMHDRFLIMKKAQELND